MQQVKARVNQDGFQAVSEKLNFFLCWEKIKNLKDKLNTGALLSISKQNACYQLEKLNLLHNVLCVYLLNILKYNSELFFFTLKNPQNDYKPVEM